jgi:hypothetical protein
MAEIRHRVGINAPAEDVYEAVTTTEGVAQWAQWFWQDARGDSRVSGRIDCYAIESTGDETVVSMTHAGWRAPTDFMGQASTKWAIYLVGLKALMEGGTGTPFPLCPKISSMG